MSIEGAVVGPRNAVNEQYYGVASVNPRQILYEGSVNLPADSLMPEVYAKLDKLAQGLTAQPDEAEKAKVEEARQSALKAGEAAQKQADVEYVDLASEK